MPSDTAHWNEVFGKKPDSEPGWYEADVEKQITGYFDNLRKLLKPGGLAMFAEFSPDGAPMCAGLSLHRYSAEELASRLGSGFALLRKEFPVYTNPFGEPRPYVYTLHRRLDGHHAPA